MVRREKAMLQRGMNFRLHATYSVLLMSIRKGAPYTDQWHEDAGLLEYEGHDEPRRKGIDPKRIDQPMHHSGGALTENGKFFEAAKAFGRGNAPADVVQVYEKIAQGIWSDRGRFELIDAVRVPVGTRKVFRFFLRPIAGTVEAEPILRHSRVIPTGVKIEVWQRDCGRCVVCGSETNLHFDHDLPYSKGGSSITAANVRVLCARHNLEKSDKISALVPWLFTAVPLLVGKSA